MVLLIHEIQSRQKKDEKAAALFIDIKDAFDHVFKKKLIERITNLKLDEDLVGQTQSFIINKKSRTYNKRVHKPKNNSKYRYLVRLPRIPDSLLNIYQRNI